MAGDICPACGYPTIGAGVCAACMPSLAVADTEPIACRQPILATAAGSLLPKRVRPKRFELPTF